MKVSFSKSKRGFSSVDVKMEDFSESAVLELFNVLKAASEKSQLAKDIFVSLRVGVELFPREIPKVFAVADALHRQEKEAKKIAEAK